MAFDAVRMLLIACCSNQFVLDIPALVICDISQKFDGVSCQAGNGFALLKQDAVARVGADFVVRGDDADQVEWVGGIDDNGLWRVVCRVAALQLSSGAGKRELLAGLVADKPAAADFSTPFQAL